MKELDQEIALKAKSIDKKVLGWRREPGVLVWIIWLGGDIRQAAEWMEQNEIENVIVGVAEADDAGLAEWHLDMDRPSTLVLVSGKKVAMSMLPDFDADDVLRLEYNLRKLLMPDGYK